MFTVTIFAMIYHNFRWLVALDAIWMYYDRNSHVTGSYATDHFRGLRIWRYFAQYFPIKLKRTIDLSPNENYIMGLVFYLFFMIYQ